MVGSIVVSDALPITKKDDGGKITSMEEYLVQHGTLSIHEQPEQKVE